MNRLSILLCAIVLTSFGCAGDETSVAENGFRFSDPTFQKAFASVLEKKGIRFRQLEDGTVIYGAADDDKVKQIQNALLESSFAPSYRFEDEKLQVRFVDRLKSQGISFAVEIREGKSWITWAQNDDARVRGIREEILDGRSERKAPKT